MHGAKQRFGPHPAPPRPPRPAPQCSDGNLDLHRGLAGPTLYANINVGKGSDALGSGGPSRAGPNSVAYSTWWNIRSNNPIDPNHSNNKPGSCLFGRRAACARETLGRARPALRHL